MEGQSGGDRAGNERPGGAAQGARAACPTPPHGSRAASWGSRSRGDRARGPPHAPFGFGSAWRGNEAGAHPSSSSATPGSWMMGRSCCSAANYAPGGPRGPETGSAGAGQPGRCDVPRFQALLLRPPSLMSHRPLPGRHQSSRLHAASPPASREASPPRPARAPPARRPHVCPHDMQADGSAAAFPRGHHSWCGRRCSRKPASAPRQGGRVTQSLRQRLGPHPSLLQAAAATPPPPPPPLLAPRPSGRRCSLCSRRRRRTPRGAPPWRCLLPVRRWPRSRRRPRQPRAPRRGGTPATGRAPAWARLWTHPRPSEAVRRPVRTYDGPGASSVDACRAPTPFDAMRPSAPHRPLPLRFLSTPGGVRVQVLAEGSGPAAAPGDRVLVDFVLRRSNGAGGGRPGLWLHLGAAAAS